MIGSVFIQQILTAYNIPKEKKRKACFPLFYSLFQTISLANTVIPFYRHSPRINDLSNVF